MKTSNYLAFRRVGANARAEQGINSESIALLLLDPFLLAYFSLFSTLFLSQGFLLRALSHTQFIYLNEIPKAQNHIRSFGISYYLLNLRMSIRNLYVIVCSVTFHGKFW